MILNFSMSGILSNKDYFNSFVEVMNVREPTEQLIKEYYYGSGIIAWKLLEISKRYNKEIRKHILPKQSKVIQGCLTALFSKESEINLAIYMGIFFYSIEKGIISEEGLDALFEKLDADILDDSRRETNIMKGLTMGLQFVYQGYDFALKILDENDKLAHEAIDILKDVYAGEIDHVLPLSKRYMEIFKKIEKPNMDRIDKEYDEISIISGIIKRTFETLESMSYILPFDIVNPRTNRLIEELKGKGIDVTSSTTIVNDVRGSLMLQSLLSIVLYSMRKDKARKIEMIYVTINERGQ